MKILKIRITNLPLTNKIFEVDFYALQKVNQDKNEMLSNLFSNVYKNNVISFIGINASGKTTPLKTIALVMNMLSSNSLNNISYKEIMNELKDDEILKIETFFFDEKKSVYKLETGIIKIQNDIYQTPYFKIDYENLSKKSITSIRSKSMIFDFLESQIIETRTNDNKFLLDDLSIIVKFNNEHKTKLEFCDLINLTNTYKTRVVGHFPDELVRFLDPSIEHLKSEYYPNHTTIISLKFFGKEEIILRDLQELDNYLSSGTIKGIDLFVHVIATLKHGGYLIVDELENHFNKEIVSTIIKFFNDSSTNQKGSTLIFSTHYIELIDMLERNDSIFVTSNINGISVDNLSKILERNDVKKSEWFQSGYFEFTSPKYNAYIELKRRLAKLHNEAENA